MQTSEQEHDPRTGANWANWKAPENNEADRTEKITPEDRFLAPGTTWNIFRSPEPGNSFRPLDAGWQGRKKLPDGKLLMTKPTPDGGELQKKVTVEDLINANSGPSEAADIAEELEKVEKSKRDIRERFGPDKKEEAA